MKRGNWYGYPRQLPRLSIPIGTDIRTNWFASRNLFDSHGTQVLFLIL